MFHQFANSEPSARVSVECPHCHASVIVLGHVYRVPEEPTINRVAWSVASLEEQDSNRRHGVADASTVPVIVECMPF